MSKKVMIVDDDRTITSLLQMLLELDGYSVRVVARGDRVLPEVRNDRPDAILMDVNLADADGLDILRALREDGDLMGLPVLMTSGMDLEDQCLAAGATAFILKPYPPDHLTQALAEILA